MPKLQVEKERRLTLTTRGGAALFSQVERKFGLGRLLDQEVHVLKRHHPYHESDHILTMALNLFAGGTCLEDQAELQHSGAVKTVLGAERLPDPTTAGDFLRRFEPHPEDPRLDDDPIATLRDAVTAFQELYWDAHQAMNGGRKGELGVVDVDSHYRFLYGRAREGADFSYKKTWSYHPLLITLANTGDCLAVENRPGNRPSADGAPQALHHVLPRVTRRYKSTLVRADSAFHSKSFREACAAQGAQFAVVGREQDGWYGIGRSIPEKAWVAYEAPSTRHRKARRGQPGFEPRQGGADHRGAAAARRAYRDLKKLRQWVAEVPYTPADSDKTYRLILRREEMQELVDAGGGWYQRYLFFQYRYVVTDLPEDYTAEDVIDLTYQRCDQEKMIAQLGNSLAMWACPVREAHGNEAWFQIARLACSIAKAIALLALPDEVLHWEWKRFRRAFVHIAAVVVKHGRQITLRLDRDHRQLLTVLRAHEALST